MAKDLITYLREHPCKGFKPIPHYFPQGDYLTFYYRGDLPCRSRRINSLLTVYLAFGTNQLVGCKIKGVKQLLQQNSSFGVSLSDSKVRLDLLFSIGKRYATEEAEERFYDELLQLADNAEVELVA